MTGSKDFQHPRFARMYLGIAERADRLGGAKHRRRMLAGLTGNVIEVGAGHGRNFAHYPDGVSGVVAVEPDDTLRGRAETAAVRVPLPVTVVVGHADALPAEEAEFDAAVASLVLCTVPRPEHALAEIRRVLRPGGLLRFYEHVRSSNAFYARIQDLVTPIWSRVGGGCHPNRDTVNAIESAGFRIEELDRFPFKPMAFQPAFTHVIGHARKS
ncbi:MAG TPA: SAM-dependent methyltransferase [Micromonosporaceae bacterium]|nr:SAM-dependent methyltransferase [Micromonosporaceae bacterium]